MEQHYIRYVALYLRKSRGEVESDLEKHRFLLHKLCEDNQWKYLEYPEVGSGDSIILRPQMQRLLTDVEGGLFDAVCVVDIDRLGRGDMGDQDKIKKAFVKSDTLVITPQQIYNLKNDDDEFVVDMKSFIARREYKQIVKRLSQGKKIGARMGMWTNGVPPYPYEYQRYKETFVPKSLVVNEEKLVHYRFIIDSLMSGVMSPQEIVDDLNRRGVRAPKGKQWYVGTLYKMALSEVHLGRIISNKSSGEAHALKKESAKEYKIHPKSEWIVVENCHQAVKTIEEHNFLLMKYSTGKSIFKREEEHIYALTGLIYCGVCGHRMTLNYCKEKDKIVLARCWFHDQNGVHCKNSGIRQSVLLPIFVGYVMEHRAKIIEAISNEETQVMSEKLQARIVSLQQDIERKKSAMMRIQDAYENGAYNLAQYKERSEKGKRELDEIMSELQRTEESAKSLDNANMDDHVGKIDSFLSLISQKDAPQKQINGALRQFIKRISYINKQKSITLDVEFY